jgi:nucleoside-diphosphate-sugar epimerase/1-acyl-sn-glycerol-3-phosphate acyltransferase
MVTRPTRSTRAAKAEVTELGGRRCILVTGAWRSTGRRLIATLTADERVARVIAVDTDPPPEPLPAKVEALRADLGSPALIRTLESAAVDTLVHLGVGAEPRAMGGRARMKERNVVGTMQLLAAAYHAPDLRRLVLKSTTAVYGAAPGDPGLWTESMGHGTPGSGFGKDSIEIEDYVRSFDRRRPDVTVTILRLANQVGPTVSNPLTRYFELPVCPTVLGFDPRLQFLHESDAERVLERAVLGPTVRGTFNVAGDGVVLLSQAIRIAGKPQAPIPEPLVPVAAEALHRIIDFSPEQARFLQYGRVADTTAARERLGFTPKWSSQEAFRDFAGSRLAPVVSDEQVERIERQVQDTGDFLVRRFTGRYQVDDFGHDPDLVDHVLAPLLRPLYKRWWRVETRGLEHVPSSGAALVVGNHAGTLPFDAMMVALAIHDEHPAHRTLRMLAADLAFTLPVVAPLARKSGNTLACEEDAQRLLGAGELVGVWPEGYKGLGKPFSERYRLRRFGRGGFVELALRTGTPIVPVAVVGSEEIYPMIGNLRRIGRVLGLPYLPVTPTFPLLGPLGAVPLPSKWLIEFCPPIETAAYGPDAVLDPMVVFDLTDQVRDTIQRALAKNLAARRGVFG